MEVHHSASASSLSVPSPTFTSYSSENLGDIAARVVGELNLSNSDPYEDDFYASLHQKDTVEHDHDHRDEEEEVGDDDDDDSEFEFHVLCREDDSSPISADEIFSNGQIRPMFPIFNTDLVFGDGENDDGSQGLEEKTIRLPLRKLLTKERENSAASCSSSEADNLDGIPQGTYCVWTPNQKKKDNDIIGKKSHSTGSCSKRFRIRDLLYRSNSDGKDTFVFLTPSNQHNHGGDQKRRERIPPSALAKKKGGGSLEGKKKSYLPYRRDLVGFFANANSISRTVRPF